MKNTIPELLQSFGLELEFLYPTQSKLGNSQLLRDLDVKVTYDVSTETQSQKCRNTGLHILKSPYEVASRSESKIGGELVTRIWNSRMGEKELLERLIQITNLLSVCGEQPRNTRSSIHVHISFVNNLDVLKKVLILGAHLEKMFFTIGGMGYEHRGMTSDSIYFRPITRSGPIVVPVPGGWAQCFTKQALLEAETLEDFYLRYGDSAVLAPRVRWPIVRYHWINLVNLLQNRDGRTRGTLELRVFNFSLDPMKILSVFLAVQKFAEYCVVAPWKEFVANGLMKEYSVFSETPISETLEVAARWFNLAGLGEKHANLLLEMISTTPQPILKERFVRSHLHDRHSVPLHWESKKFVPERVLAKKVNQPIYHDLYTVAGSDRIRHFDNLRQLRNSTVTSRT